MAAIEEGPVVVRTKLLSMQICVPASWSDRDAEVFANTKNPAGTTHGWRMRKEGEESLAGDPERAKCADREGYVHIMLDC